jgi:hypothetical protein
VSTGGVCGRGSSSKTFVAKQLQNSSRSIDPPAIGSFTLPRSTFLTKLWSSIRFNHQETMQNQKQKTTILDITKRPTGQGGIINLRTAFEAAAHSSAAGGSKELHGFGASPTFGVSPSKKRKWGETPSEISNRLYYHVRYPPNRPNHAAKATNSTKYFLAPIFVAAVCGLILAPPMC